MVSNRQPERSALTRLCLPPHVQLDEVVDYGYAQDTSTELLKRHIHNEPIVVRVLLEKATHARFAGVCDVVCLCGSMFMVLRWKLPRLSTLRCPL